MNLINPWALLTLGLIPILLLIHSLKPKARQVEITNLFLWQEALKDRGGGIRIKKLLKNLPLWLQILSVVLAALTLAEPVWIYSPKTAGNEILVIDTSASMKAKTESGIRFDQARQQALKRIDELPESSKMLIIEAGSKPKLTSNFSGDKKHLKKIVGAIRPSDTPGLLVKAMFLALSFMDPNSDDHTVLITDGSGVAFDEGFWRHPKVRPVLVGGGTKNIGLTRVRFRQALDLRDRYEIMVEVKNYNQYPVLCPIHLTLKDETILKKTVGLRAMEKKLLIIPYKGTFSGIVRARIGTNDDFPVDNEAFAVLESSQDVWVLLVTKENYFLEKILGAHPNFMVNSVNEIIDSSWRDQTLRHDIVILDRISPPISERGNFLFIDAFSPSIPVVEIGRIESPEILDWNRKHPLMSNIDWSGVRIEEAALVESAEHVRPLLDSRQTGLMFAYEKKGLRAVFLGFDVTKSDLPLRIAFPVMMGNIFEWLHPDKLRFTSYQTKSGKPFTIYLNPQTKTFSVEKPSGKKDRYLAQTNPFEYGDTTEVGIYRIVEGETRRSFAVNLLDESESDIRPPPPGFSTRETPDQTGSEPARMEFPLWIFFLLTAGTGLVLEWYFWTRGN